MNVPLIKFLCWVSSAALTFFIAAYAYGFRQRLPEIHRPFDKDYVKAVLDENIDVPVEVKEGIDYDEVRRRMITLNWTGKEAPKPVDPGPVAPVDTTPRYKPVAEILRLLMIQVDVVDPGGSRIFVKYLDPAAALQHGSLGVGDPLPKPHDGVLVHQIRIDGIEFAFSTEGRENETVVPGRGDLEPLIYKVGEGQVRVPVRRQLPRATARTVERPAETRLIGNNMWELGTEDSSYFGDNYAEILTKEVSTRVHYDDKGRRSGIEVTDVRAGSIASRHGVQTGDVLISINGHSVHSEQEAIRYVKNNSDRYTVWEVVIERMGRLETQVYRSPQE